MTTRQELSQDNVRDILFLKEEKASWNDISEIVDAKVRIPCPLLVCLSSFYTLLVTMVTTNKNKFDQIQYL